MKHKLEAKSAWILRHHLKSAIRDFFLQREFIEVDTPAAVICPGTEVHLDYFSTEWKDYNKQTKKLWLRSSPELHMKQVLGQGLERIFQFANCFRNAGELSHWHHPEFTMLEWYQVGIGYQAFMNQTIELLLHAEQRLASCFPDLVATTSSSEFTKISMLEAFREFAGVELVDQDMDLTQKARDIGIVSVRQDDDFETAFYKILIEKIEPKLKALRRVVLYDFPASQAALARIENGVAKRFEVYWDGVELSNGFFELMDQRANKKRLDDSNHYRNKLGKDILPVDEYFLKSFARNYPDTCGNALGFERFLAVLLNQSNLNFIMPLSRQDPFYIPTF